MSLPHAILTSLAERPGSGSELASRFDRSIGYFWQATHQQIYRELARLEAAGWVEAEPVEGARGGKRRFRILQPGREELRRWVNDRQDPPAIRDELMVRIRAEAVVGPTHLADELAASLSAIVRSWRPIWRSRPGTSPTNPSRTNDGCNTWS